jgi:hypothetical protein
LESTHLQDSERLSKLIALLSPSLCWAILTGEWLVAKAPIPLKKHGRKAKNIFRTGLDYLQHSLLNLEHKNKDFLAILKFLSST